MALNKVRKEKLALEMEKRQHDDCIELERTKIDKRNRFANLTRYMQMQRQELEQADALAKQKLTAIMQDSDVKREEKLAQELDKVTREEIRELRMRQILRETDPDLRELQAKLKAAYVNKQLLTQLAEREAMQLEKKIKEKQAQEILDAARIGEQECLRKEAEEDMIQKAKYKQYLQDQMIYRERVKRYDYEEFLRQKKTIDDIVQRIHDEDERLLQEKMCRMQKTRQEMIAFREAQEIWKEKKRIQLEDENRRIKEYLQEKAREEHMRNMVKHEEEIRRAKISEDIARKLYEEQHLQRERQYYIQELQAEELKAKLDDRHKQDIETEIRKRLEMQQALDRQLEEKEEKLKREAEEDAAFKEQFLAKLAEDERLDQLTNEKRKIKMMQLRKDVQQMMIDRRQQRAEDMQKLLRLDEEEKKENERRRQLIEDERIKILQEHAKNLIGYLPRGVLREDDLPILGGDIEKNYTKHEHIKMEASD